jgi:hypothetical protein
MDQSGFGERFTGAGRNPTVEKMHENTALMIHKLDAVTAKYHAGEDQDGLSRRQPAALKSSCSLTGQRPWLRTAALAGEAWSPALEPLQSAARSTLFPVNEAGPCRGDFRPSLLR